jgi:transcription antitermination protein NusB
MTTTATGSRRQGREAALQALYLVDVCRRPAGDIPETAWAETPLPPKTRAFALSIIEGVAANHEAIDAIIRRYAENWEMGRMAAIDRSLLRLASFELLYDLETPVNVIINEALEIAKKYSTADSSKFVNGILDKVKLERKI